mgnify:CR=1 FL=1
MEIKIEQLKEPSLKDVADVLNMYKKIPGRSCSAAAYFEYLFNHWSTLGLFVVRKNGSLIGFAHVEGPNMLDPKFAYMPFTFTGRGCGSKRSKAMLKLAEEWMSERGATKWAMQTLRNPKVLERAYGVTVAKEVLMEKEIPNGKVE